MNYCLAALLSVLLLSRGAASPHGQDAAAPNSVMMKTDLLVVTAHPDDESMMAATMARYADEGRVVALAVCTHGEGGGNGTGKESGPALGIVRETELRRCLSLLGTRHLTFLNQPDWAYTESVRATLAKWGHDETLRRLVRLIRILRPDVIATMDPAPSGGQHGHHQAAGRLATEAFRAAADPSAFPELKVQEGLSVWRARKLYWVGGANSRTQIPVDGIAKGALAAASPDASYAAIARRAESNHRSQGFDKFFGGAQTGSAPARPQSFTLVKSHVPNDAGVETDLFANVESAALPSNPDVLINSRSAVSAVSPIEAFLQPSPAVRDYRGWLRANGIARLMTRLPAHVPVTIGGTSPVVVEVVSHSDAARKGRVLLDLPTGWKSHPAAIPFAVGPGGTKRVTFQVETPRNALVSGYDVAVRIEGEPKADAGKFDALPQLRVRSIARAFPVDARPEKWLRAGFAPVSIRPNSAEGSAAGPEVEGRFFVGYDASGLRALVEVTDDTVVANIAPDDIKAHWRTTSAEICIDPSPRADNTFGTLKLGIFPADTAGHVRAARDADANPGPVDRNERGIQLASRRTASGYCVEARIPWAALHTRPEFRPAKGRTLGFNVILYHAGKKDARVGEDVGKSRLAWSFWPGVWGRPDVWGTAVLD